LLSIPMAFNSSAIDQNWACHPYPFMFITHCQIACTDTLVIIKEVNTWLKMGRWESSDENPFTSCLVWQTMRKGEIEL
jgi:hypothetical protein